MCTDLFKQILQDHRELSSLPQTLAEVLRVSRDPNASAGELSKVLQRDPGLTTKILRLANSPYFGAGREITSMTQAVMTLGNRSVVALALAASIYQLTGQWETSFDPMRFWRHSLNVAVASRCIGQAIQSKFTDEAFISGLLHDIGLLIIQKSFPEKFGRIWTQAEAGARTHELEEAVWGTNHARIGRFLLEQWNIPHTITSAVGQHHNNFPAEETSDPDFELAQIVALGDRLAQFTTVRAKPEGPEDVEQKSILMSNLGLDKAKMKEIQEKLLPQTMEEAAFLEIDIGTPHDVLTEANRLLYDQYLTVEKLLADKRSMQREIARTQMEKASLDALQTITATFNHYVNNAAATILGRAQLLQVDLQRGRLIDKSGCADLSLETIVQGVSTIKLVLDELTSLNSFKTTVYYDDARILDIEKKLKERLAELQESTGTCS